MNHERAVPVILREDSRRERRIDTWMVPKGRNRREWASEEVVDEGGFSVVLEFETILLCRVGWSPGGF